MNFLKQSTAVDIMFGPFLDETTGKDAETALTITQAEVRISKNGANIIQKNEATSLVHDELGYYVLKLDETDTGTLGILKVMVHESGALPVWNEFLVVTANIYDSLCSTDILQADLIQMGGVAQSATDLKDFADDGYNPATNKITGVLLADATTVCNGLAANTITAASINADAITSAKIADDAISAEHLNTGAITADAFAADAIVAATLATGAITADAFAANSIVAATLAADCITEAKIADNAIAAEHIAAAAIDNATFAADVGSTAYATNIIALAVRKALDDYDPPTKGELDTAQGAVTVSAINANVITATSIQADAIAAAKIATGAFTADAFAADALVAATFATGAFTADAFAANALVAATFAADCITAAKVAADVHTENATAVWAKTEAVTGNANSYGSIAEKLFRFFMNDMLITDATGAVALRNEANDGDIATQTITDDDTTTTRTDLVWL